MEPDEATQRLLETVLRRDGFEPLVVSDGHTALNALARANFAAFLVDVTLAPSALEPGALRGVGFLRHLARERPSRMRRVVVVSALAPETLPHDLLQRCRFVRKPFDIEDLRTAINDCAAIDALAS